MKIIAERSPWTVHLQIYTLTKIELGSSPNEVKQLPRAHFTNGLTARNVDSMTLCFAVGWKIIIHLGYNHTYDTIAVQLLHEENYPSDK